MYCDNYKYYIVKTQVFNFVLGSISLKLSFNSKINLIFYFIKEFKKNNLFKFFYEMVDRFDIKVKMNSKFGKNQPSLLLTFME